MNHHAVRINNMLYKHSTGNDNNNIYSYWWDTPIDEEIHSEEAIATMETAHEIVMMFLGEEQDFRRYIHTEYIADKPSFQRIYWVDEILRNMNADDTETYITIADQALEGLKEDYDYMISHN